MVLVAPDHIESGSGRLIAKVSAADQGAISGKYLFSPGDTLYSKIRPYLRKAVLADFGGLTSADMYPLRPTVEVEPRFLLAILLGEHFSRFAEIVSMRSGFPKINREEFAEYVVALPQLAEQRRITEILATLDEAIRKTEQLIAKLKQVKQGLLHDLLARGIDDNGGLRDPERHPEQFVSAELGVMPLGWKVLSLVECLSGTPTNGIYKPSSAIGRGSLLIGQTGVTEERSIDFHLARRAVLNASELSHYGLAAGDILVSRVFATIEGVGQPALVPEPPEPAVYESNMMRLCANRAIIVPYLLFRWLRSDPVRRLIGERVNSSNQTSINQRELNSLPIRVPTLPEQQRIVEVLTAADRRITDEDRALGKQKLLKEGLMEDLLTGRVRVTNLLDEAAA